MRTILLFILLAVAVQLTGQESSSFYVVYSSKVNTTVLSNIAIYGFHDRNSVNYRNIYLTQVLQAPNTNYWVVICSTATKQQDRDVNSFIAAGVASVIERYAYIVIGDYSYIYVEHVSNLPNDFYTVGVSST